jgi:hypothetical protein
MIADAIVAAVPHERLCMTTRAGGKCTCGAVSRRAVLYTQVQEHVHRLTQGRVYLR